MAQTLCETVTFFVNGKKIQDNEINPEWTLLYYLRNKLKLTGTKLGCSEGGCGACTVMISKYDRSRDKITHVAINACLAPICSVHGTAVTTVEGIGTTRTRLHPVQESIANSHGSQCGYCTPGIVMSMYTLLRNTPKPSMEQVEEAFQGNLCRCTGYRPIIEGCKSFTCDMGENCCKKKNGVEAPSSNSTQEPIFPPELKLSDQFDRDFLAIKSANLAWFRPTSLEGLLKVKSENPGAKLVVGNTEIGIETKFKNMRYPVLVHAAQIPELLRVGHGDGGVTVGAAVTLQSFEEVLREEIQRVPKHKTRSFQAILSILNLFASKQIRNIASIGGNIMTGSPISDLIPILMVNKAILHVQSQNGKRDVILDEAFFKSYRTTVLEPHEVLVAITIPYTQPNSYSYTYKQSRRRDDDIAIVNFAINVTVSPQNLVIEKISLAFGGMSFKTVRASKTEKKLEGLEWKQDIIETAFSTLLEDLPLDFSAPGGMAQYRQALCLSLFLKAFLAVSADLNLAIDSSEMSAVSNFEALSYESSQYFTVVPENRELGAVRQPTVHLSAFKQASGEAVYCDDMPKFENELFLAFVTSSKAHARIKSIDPSAALGLEGVVDFISARDLAEDKNSSGPVIKDEKVFYNEEVTSEGLIIAGVLATDQNVARRAAKLVKVEYEELEPVILTIEDAIKHDSFLVFDHDTGRVITKGNFDEIVKSAPLVIEGECKTGGQEHFYLETHSAIVVPKEGRELDVYCTTQNPTHLAKMLSEVFDIEQNRIAVKVRRLGGGFGGKDTKPNLIAVPATLAALKLNRPVRCTLDRDEDIVMTAGRHPFWARYKAAFDKNGKILGADIEMYVNGGHSLDASHAVLEKAMLHVDNAYNFPHLRVRGAVCKTNLPSFTAFRGFGGPQGMFVAETILQDIADRLVKPKKEICELNMYRDGDITHYDQTLTDCTANKCWEECLATSNYNGRIAEIRAFNAKNRYKKRGLSLACSKHGIAISAKYLNQGAALVMVYRDGSVLVSHGGVEMGQGLLTKLIQVASTVLEIPVGKIHTTETATDKVPNTTVTGGSTGSDLYGMAVLEACRTIKSRLDPYKAKNPNATWEERVNQAYFDRVSLCATGFYKTPNLREMWTNEEGDIYLYFTYGVACSEVEVDTLTGEHQVRRVDIVMDLGESLNPAIDVGQIEGAFVQGYGLFVLEEMVYSPKGILLTRGPGTYKLPGFGDIPKKFNVSLLKGASNPRALFSSKAVGEPPLFLGSSVFFAIKEAIKACRDENGVTTKFQMKAPATCEAIRMACQDKIVQKVQVSKENEQNVGKQPWSVSV